MICESNTLTWQETAERKNDDAKKRKEHGDEKRKVWRIRGLLLLFGCIRLGRGS